MSSILLSKSSAAQVVECPQGATFVFGFPTDEAQLSRSGSDLVLSFDDGGSITLSGFYDTYNQQDMPNFEVGGAEVAGADFFAALDQPDLMPAAGPQTAEDGTHYQEWSNMELLGGLDRLGGLDVGWPDGMPEPDIDGAAQGDYVDYPVTIFAMEDEPSDPDDPNGGRVPPGSPDPLDPDTPFYPDDPTDPEDDPANMGTNSAHLFVREEDLGGNIPPQDSGYLLIDAPNGVDTIVIDGITVWQNGSMTAATTIPTDEGYLEVTGFDEETGRFDFTYTLERATQEHAAEGADIIVQHPLPITVTDKDGSVGTGDITVTIKDDIPTAEGEIGTSLEEAVVVADSEDGNDSGVAESSGNVLDNDAYGEDGRAADYVDWGAASVTGGHPLSAYGTLTLNEDGSWKFELDTSSEVLRAMDENVSVTVSVPYVITDADGDTAEAVLTFDIVGADNAVSIVPDPDPVDPPTPDSDIPGPDPEDPIPTPDPEDPFVDTDSGVGVADDSLTVKDSALAYGTAPNDAALSESGSMAIYAPDLLSSITLTLGDGTPVTVPFDGRFVIIPVGDGDGEAPAARFTAFYAEGRLHYTFELDSSHQHFFSSDAQSWDITVTATDSDGDFDSALIRLGIEDDKPVFVETGTADAAVPDEAAGVTSSLKGEFSGEFGADNDVMFFKVGNAEAQAVPAQDRSITFVVEGGQLTITNEGNGKYGYEYKPDNLNLSIFDKKFTITAIDADGDTDQTVVTVNIDYEPDIEDGPDAPEGDSATPHVTDNHIVVDDADAAGVSLGHVGHGASGTGAFVVDLHGEDGTITVGNAEIAIVNGAVETSLASPLDTGGANGVAVEISGVSSADGKWVVEYSYELEEAWKHDSDEDSASASISISVKDASSPQDEATSSLSIEVHDHIPVVKVTGANYTEQINNFEFEQETDRAFLDFSTVKSAGSSLESFALDSGLEGVTMKAVTMTMDYNYTMTDPMPEVVDFTKAAGVNSVVVRDSNGNELTWSDADGNSQGSDLNGLAEGTRLYSGNVTVLRTKTGYRFSIKAEDDGSAVQSTDIGLTIDTNVDDSAINLTAAKRMLVTISDDAIEHVSVDGNAALSVVKTDSSRAGITVTGSDRLGQEIAAPAYNHTSQSWTLCFGDKVTLNGSEYSYTAADVTKDLPTSGILNGLVGEGIEFTLTGLAYGIKLDLGSFFSADGNKGAAATTGDPNAEDCLVLFYKGKTLVGHRLYNSRADLGKFDSSEEDTFGAFITQGFDKVVIASAFNGSNSDFTITGLDFFTQPTILTRAEGTLDLVAADKPDSTVIPQFDHSGTIDVLIENTDENGDVTYTSAEASIVITTVDGEGQMQALVNGEALFTAMLSKATGETGDQWNWSFRLHQEFKLADGSESFELKFKWDDADGDTGRASVTLNTLDNELLDSTVYIDGTGLGDMLEGSDQDDSLDGGAGDDYLDGGAGADSLYGGTGHDIFVYDAADALIQGGDGIDFLLSNGDLTDTGFSALSLSDMSNVQDVEVLVKGTEAESLTSLSDLADVGISIADGKVSFDSTWTQTDTDSSDGYVAFQHDPGTGIDLEVEVAASILQNTAS